MSTNWQPIVTAPKDGTRVLLYDSQYEGLIDIGIWDYGQWCTDMGTMEPTHWMPISPPPDDAPLTGISGIRA